MNINAPIYPPVDGLIKIKRNSYQWAHWQHYEPLTTDSPWPVLDPDLGYQPPPLTYALFGVIRKPDFIKGKRDSNPRRIGVATAIFTKSTMRIPAWGTLLSFPEGQGVGTSRCIALWEEFVKHCVELGVPQDKIFAFSMRGRPVCIIGTDEPEVTPSEHRERWEKSLKAITRGLSEMAQLNAEELYIKRSNATSRHKTGQGEHEIAKPERFQEARQARAVLFGASCSNDFFFVKKNPEVYGGYEVHVKLSKRMRQPWHKSNDYESRLEALDG